VTWQPIQQYCVEHRDRTPLAREHQDVIGGIIPDTRSTTGIIRIIIIIIIVIIIITTLLWYDIPDNPETLISCTSELLPDDDRM
jgi:hypothetical protein